MLHKHMNKQIKKNNTWKAFAKSNSEKESKSASSPPYPLLASAPALDSVSNLGNGDNAGTCASVVSVPSKRKFSVMAFSQMKVSHFSTKNNDAKVKRWCSVHHACSVTSRFTALSSFMSFLVLQCVKGELNNIFGNNSSKS